MSAEIALEDRPSSHHNPYYLRHYNKNYVYVYIYVLFATHCLPLHSHSVSELEVENEKLRSEYDQLRTSIKHGVEINELNGNRCTCRASPAEVLLTHFPLSPSTPLCHSSPACRSTGRGS